MQVIDYSLNNWMILTFNANSLFMLIENLMLDVRWISYIKKLKD